jgi:hypothetical protein
VGRTTACIRQDTYPLACDLWYSQAEVAISDWLSGMGMGWSIRGGRCRRGYGLGSGDLRASSACMPEADIGSEPEYGM